MNFILQLLQIMVFKRKPQDLNYDINAASIIFICYVASTFYQLKLTGLLPDPLFFSGSQALMHAACYSFILFCYKKQSRFVQMLSAIFGINCILQLLSLLVTATPFAIVGFYLSIWSLVMSVYVLRETIERKTGEAILLTIALQIVVTVFLFALFPEFYQKIADLIQAESAAS